VMACLATFGRSFGRGSRKVGRCAYELYSGPRYLEGLQPDRPAARHLVRALPGHGNLPATPYDLTAATPSGDSKPWVWEGVGGPETVFISSRT